MFYWYKYWFKYTKLFIILLFPFNHITISAVCNCFLFILDQEEFMKMTVKRHCVSACLSLAGLAIGWSFLNDFYLLVAYEVPEFYRKHMPILEVSEFIKYLEYYPIFKNYVENLDDITLTVEYETVDELIEILELKKSVEDVTNNMDFVLGIPTDWYELSKSQQIDLENMKMEAVARDQKLKSLAEDTDPKTKRAILVGTIVVLITLYFYFGGRGPEPEIIQVFEGYMVVRPVTPYIPRPPIIPQPPFVSYP